MQKVLNYFFSLLFTLSLTACSSLPLATSDQLSPTENSKDIFIDPYLAHYMENSDRLKLHNLIATAPAQQVVTWHSRSAYTRFEFASLEIYVNEKGQGCRNYRITLKRGFLEPHAFPYTACRDNQGDWQVTQQI
jgi:hypothetical protein